MKADEKVAVVTGGGRGIGRGITLKLLDAGYKVLVAQRKVLDHELAHNFNVTWVEVDLSDLGSTETIAEAAQDYFGGANLLVNNAGMMFEQSLEHMTEAEWERMAIINVRAPVFLTKSLLPQLKAKRNASVVNIGSIEGVAANPEHIAYSTTKAGVHGMTRAMAVDLGQYRVRCNAVAPGWIDTELSEKYIASQTNPTKARSKLLAQHPLGRTGKTEDIGNAVAFLASEQAEFITGQVLVVDGGRTAKLPLPF